MASTALQLLKEGDKFARGDKLFGVFKAIVEDISDPLALGHVRIRIYALHGMEEFTPVENLPWAEPLHSQQGSFSIPEVGDRVWVMFENGERTNPIWIGHWMAVPANQESNFEQGFPYWARKGSEVPQEAWITYKRRPQASVLSRSREGNAIWFEDKVVGSDKYVGKINVQNANGDFFKLTAYRNNGDYDNNLERNPQLTYRWNDISDVDESKGSDSELSFGTRAFKFFNQVTESGKTRSVDETRNPENNDRLRNVKLNGNMQVQSTGTSVEDSSISMTKKYMTTKSLSHHVLSEFRSLPRKWK